MNKTNKVDKAKTDPLEPRVISARYLASGAKVSDLPAVDFPEVAFAGRSNVGKSSLLNALVSRKSLVRTSKTPGATRAVNLFEAKLASGEGIVLADLPGYGFAQRSKAERASWGPMLERYLREREGLIAICVLIDVRRGASDDDLELLAFASSLERPLAPVAVVTKIDKLPLAKRKPEIARIKRAIEARLSEAPEAPPAGTQRTASARVAAVGMSAVTGEGRELVWSRLRALLRPGDAP